MEHMCARRTHQSRLASRKQAASLTEHVPCAGPAHISGPQPCELRGPSCAWPPRSPAYCRYHLSRAISRRRRPRCAICVSASCHMGDRRQHRPVTQRHTGIRSRPAADGRTSTGVCDGILEYEISMEEQRHGISFIQLRVPAASPPWPLADDVSAPRATRRPRRASCRAPPRRRARLPGLRARRCSRGRPRP